MTLLIGLFLILKAEALGALGKVDEAKEQVRQADKFKQERAALDRLLAQSANPTSHIEDLANQLSKPMEVCQVCGCFMLVNDVQQRIDDHYAGKQHMAYARIRATIEEMDRKREEKRKACGDLYHENNPSREMQHRVTRLLRRYCLNDRPVALRFLSDPVVNFAHSAFGNVNYEDSNINVGLPIFTIHGNHDDLSGKGLTALDILHESGLINLFGKFEEIDQFIVSPILLVKGKTKLALYGIGSQRDDRLCRAFREYYLEEEIRFLRPKEDTESWFNILVLHQNRPVRTRARSTGGHLPENLIPSFFDLVIWGHEHECKIDPQYYENGVNVCGDGFYIIQPGSTIATALSPEEAKPKHIALVTISGRKFFSQKIALETPRQILFADLAITIKPPSTVSKNSRPKNMPDEKLIAAEVEKMLAEAEKMKTTRQAHPPLLRLRVTYPESWANFMKLNCRQFGAAYLRRIANPSDMITVKIMKSKNEGKKRRDGFKVATNIERVTTVEEIVSSHFAAQGNDTLMVLDTETLNDVVKSQVEQEDGKRIKNKLVIENLQIKKKKLIDALCKVSYDNFLSFDKIPSHQFLEQFEELINSDIKKVRSVSIQGLKSTE
ncbi:hypothetical protein X798_07039 [Onchocerca flexuosa]|uniref:Mre11 DNA-binding domain-containing protein n=2 Tax=Onchocerca flexuosa TaxID=387005 RepID=A0A238BN68_9BILA|nr:hypothetical protein X798_07039 [Onchocerca flexuosa]